METQSPTNANGGTDATSNGAPTVGTPLSLPVDSPISSPKADGTPISSPKKILLIRKTTQQQPAATAITPVVAQSPSASSTTAPALAIDSSPPLDATTIHPIDSSAPATVQTPSTTVASAITTPPANDGLATPITPAGTKKYTLARRASLPQGAQVTAAATASATTASASPIIDVPSATVPLALPVEVPPTAAAPVVEAPAAADANVPVASSTATDPPAPSTIPASEPSPTIAASAVETTPVETIAPSPVIPAPVAPVTEQPVVVHAAAPAVSSTQQLKLDLQRQLSTVQQQVDAKAEELRAVQEKRQQAAEAQAQAATIAATSGGSEQMNKRYSLQRRTSGGFMTQQVNQTAAPAVNTVASTPVESMVTPVQPVAAPVPTDVPAPPVAASSLARASATHVSSPSIPDHPAMAALRYAPPPTTESTTVSPTAAVPTAAAPISVSAVPFSAASDDLPDHPAAQALSRQVSPSEATQQLAIPSTTAQNISVLPLTPQKGDEVQRFIPDQTPSPTPQAGVQNAIASPQKQDTQQLLSPVPITAFATPVKSVIQPDSTTEVEPLSGGRVGTGVPSPSVTPAVDRSRNASPGPGRRGGGLGADEKLPALPGSRRHSLNPSQDQPLLSPLDEKRMSRRQSRVNPSNGDSEMISPSDANTTARSRRASLNPSSLSEVPLISPQAFSSSGNGPNDQQAQSNSRRNSLQHLPPISVSPNQGGAGGGALSAASQNNAVVPFNANVTPSHSQQVHGRGPSSRFDSPSGRRLDSPGDRRIGSSGADRSVSPAVSSRMRLALGHPSDGNITGHMQQSSGEQAFAEAVQMAMLKGSPAAGQAGGRDSPMSGVAGDALRTPITVGGVGASRRVSRVLLPLSPQTGFFTQQDPQSALATPSALAAPNRLRWILSLLPGILLLTAALILLFVRSGYTELNPAADKVVLAGLILHAVGLLGFLVISILILVFGSPFHRSVGFLYMLSLTATMLGTAAFIQSRQQDEMTKIFDSNLVGVFQLELLAVFLLLIAFLVWLYRAPERSTQRVLVVLDGIDLSSLSRDVRTMKGINAELITAIQNGVAPETFRAVSRPVTAGAPPQTAGEVRPSTGQRPGTALMNGAVVELPAYALGTYDNPLGHTRPGSSAGLTASMRAPKAERKKAKKDRNTMDRNFQQFLSVGAMTSMLAPAPVSVEKVSAPKDFPTPDNFALPASSRRNSMDGIALKQMMAANIVLAQRVNQLEANQLPPPTPPTGRVADRMDNQPPATFRPAD